MSHDRPNLLFVFGDQWRRGAVGYVGNGDVKTPHVDRLAEQSIELRYCVAGSPVCCPWRASMLTGTYPDRHGVFLNDGTLSPDARTFGEHFADAGYDTAWVGKWHVDGVGREAYIPPERRHRFGYWKTLECTHNYNDSHYYAGDSDELLTWEGYDAFAQTDDLIGWLRGRGKADPFCAFLSWGPPHNPYHTAPPEYRAIYDPAKLTVPPNVPADMAEGAASNLAGYYAHCTALDDCVGKLVAALDEIGAAENTVLVFTADHGDFIGAHGLYDKQGPWDEALRVPMLLRWPAGLGREPRSSDVVYDMVDHFPTLSALCGLDVPETAQGRDLSAHLRDGTTPESNEALYGSYFDMGNWYGQSRDKPIDPLYRSREARGLRTTRHTYVEDHDGPWLLYDNEADPHQMMNLADAPEHAALRGELAGRLKAKLDAKGDRFEPGEAYLDRFYPGVKLGKNRERRGEFQ